MTEYFIFVPESLSEPLSVISFDPDPDYSGFIQFLQRSINCDCIESVSLPYKHSLMIVDESGLLKPNPKINVRATILYHSAHIDDLLGDYIQNPIVGNAILGKSGFRDGEPDLVGYTNEPDAIVMMNWLADSFSA